MKPLHPGNFSAAHHPWNIDALVNWCEKDFDVVPFIAEFFNTISNVWMIVFASFGLHNARKYGYERRFSVAYLALLLVGIGSTLFHGTLRYHMQLLDELPMLFGSSVFIYCSIQTTRPHPWWPWTLVASLYPIVITALYVENRVAEFFQIAYAAQVAMIIALVAKNMIFFPHDTSTATPAANRRPQRTVQSIQQEGRVLCWMAFGFYMFASAIWMAENQLCYSHFIPMKERVGWPANILLEGHAWWHLFSAYGSYVATTYMVAVRAVCMPLAECPKQRTAARDSAIAWMGPLPYIVLGPQALDRVPGKLKAK